MQTCVEENDEIICSFKIVEWGFNGRKHECDERSNINNKIVRGKKKEIKKIRNNNEFNQRWA